MKRSCHSSVLFCSFGMIHDGEGNPCRKTEGNIMSPTLAGNNGVFFWSTCSRQYLSRFLGLVPVLHSRAPTQQLVTHLYLSSYMWNMDGLLCSPEPPRLPVWWMSRSKLVSTSTLKSFLDSYMMQTRSASGSLVPRPNCAALILSRWDILHHIRHGSAVNKPEKSIFHTTVSLNTHMEELQFPVCSAMDALLNWGFITQHFFTKAFPDCPPSLLVVVYRPLCLAHSWMLIHMEMLFQWLQSSNCWEIDFAKPYIWGINTRDIVWLFTTSLTLCHVSLTQDQIPHLHFFYRQVQVGAW